MLYEKGESLSKTAKRYEIKEKMGHKSVRHENLVISKR